jgi:hypothetical protein
VAIVGAVDVPPITIDELPAVTDVTAVGGVGKGFHLLSPSTDVHVKTLPIAAVSLTRAVATSSGKGLSFPIRTSATDMLNYINIVDIILI